MLRTSRLKQSLDGQRGDKEMTYQKYATERHQWHAEQEKTDLSKWTFIKSPLLLFHLSELPPVRAPVLWNLSAWVLWKFFSSTGNSLNYSTWRTFPPLCNRTSLKFVNRHLPSAEVGQKRCSYVGTVIIMGRFEEIWLMNLYCCYRG